MASLHAAFEDGRYKITRKQSAEVLLGQPDKPKAKPYRHAVLVNRFGQSPDGAYGLGEHNSNTSNIRNAPAICLDGLKDR